MTSVSSKNFVSEYFRLIPGIESATISALNNYGYQSIQAVLNLTSKDLRSLTDIPIGQLSILRTVIGKLQNDLKSWQLEQIPRLVPLRNGDFALVPPLVRSLKGVVLSQNRPDLNAVITQIIGESSSTAPECEAELSDESNSASEDERDEIESNSASIEDEANDDSFDANRTTDSVEATYGAGVATTSGVNDSAILPLQLPAKPQFSTGL
jgi:hypothetical protein